MNNNLATDGNSSHIPSKIPAGIPPKSDSDEERLVSRKRSKSGASQLTSTRADSSRDKISREKGKEKQPDFVKTAEDTQRSVRRVRESNVEERAQAYAKHKVGREGYDPLDLAFQKAFQKEARDTKETRVLKLTEKWESPDEYMKRGYFRAFRENIQEIRESRRDEDKRVGKQKIPNQEIPVDSGKGKEKEHIPESEKEFGRVKGEVERSQKGKGEHAVSIEKLLKSASEADQAASYLQERHFLDETKVGDFNHVDLMTEGFNDAAILARARLKEEEPILAGKIRDLKESPGKERQLRDAIADLEGLRAACFNKDKALNLYKEMSELSERETCTPIDIFKMRILIQDLRGSEAFKELKDKQLDRDFVQLDQKLAAREQQNLAEIAPHVQKINPFLEENVNVAIHLGPSEAKKVTELQERLRTFIDPLKTVCDQKHKSFVNAILSSTPEEYKKLLDQFVKETNENSLDLFGNLSLDIKIDPKLEETIKKDLKPGEDLNQKIKEHLRQNLKDNLSKLSTISSRAESLRRFALYSILDVDDPKHREKVYNFFSEAADRLANKKHDFYSSSCLIGATNDGNVTRSLPKAKASKEHDDLVALFTATGARKFDKKTHKPLVTEDGKFVTEPKPIEIAHRKYERKKTFLPAGMTVIGNIQHRKDIEDAPEFGDSLSHIREDRESIFSSALAAQRHGKAFKNPTPAQSTNLLALETARSEDDLYHQSQSLST
jgi:hypothetical protein